jgi:hypothetical protein
MEYFKLKPACKDDEINTQIRAKVVHQGEINCSLNLN